MRTTLLALILTATTGCFSNFDDTGVVGTMDTGYGEDTGTGMDSTYTSTETGSTDGGTETGGSTDADEDEDGWTVGEGDCDDTDDSINPDAAEAWDGIDSDCDDEEGIDELTVEGFYGGSHNGVLLAVTNGDPNRHTVDIWMDNYDDVTDTWITWASSYEVDSEGNCVRLLSGSYTEDTIYNGSDCEGDELGLGWNLTGATGRIKNTKEDCVIWGNYPNRHNSDETCRYLEDVSMTND